MVWIVEDLHAADLGHARLTRSHPPGSSVACARGPDYLTTRSHDPRLGERKMERLYTDLSRRDRAPARAAVGCRRRCGRRGHPRRLGAARRVTSIGAADGGNPLFVVECVRAARGGGAEGIERMISALPPTVRQVVLERVALLPESTRQALEVGAIVGREFSAPLIAPVLDMPVARVIDVLVPALRAGVVREAKPGQFAFSHVLVRDAIEDALSESIRARLHADVERGLAAFGDSAEILVERARHALGSLHGGAHGSANVIGLVRRASELLEHEHAYDRAFELEQRIAEARGAGSLPPATPAERLRAGTIAREAGRSDETRRLCDEVIAHARGSADAQLFSRAVLLRAGDIRPGVVDTYEIGLLEEARRMLAGRNPETLLVTARLATALQPADDFSIPNGLAQEALRGAHAFGDDTAVLEVLDSSLGCYGMPNADRIAWSRELYERASRVGDIPKALNAASQLASWQIESGDFDAYADSIATALALSDGRHPRYRWDPLLHASGHACALGRFADSDRYVTEVMQIAAVIDDPALANAPAAHAIGRARLRRQRDEIEHALAAFARVAPRLKRGELYVEALRASSYARLEDGAVTRASLAKLGRELACSCSKWIRKQRCSWERRTR